MARTKGEIKCLPRPDVRPPVECPTHTSSPFGTRTSYVRKCGSHGGMDTPTATARRPVHPIAGREPGSRYPPPATGQHEPHPPCGAPVIVHVHIPIPLYEQVQVDPEQAASQRFPVLSLQDAWHEVAVLGPEVPPPEHEVAPPVGRGMLGHTVLGALPAGATTVVGFGVLLSEQAERACCSESHPPTNCASPELSQVGRIPSMQRKKAYTCDAHPGIIAGKFVQLVAQSLPPPREHPAAATLLQMSEHALETSVEEQLSPHAANGPVPPPESSRAPHPRAGTRAIAAAAETILTFHIAFTIVITFAP